MSDPAIPPEPGHSARQTHERLKAARHRRGGDEPGAYERAFEKGADGERLVGNSLDIAARSVGTVSVLHDLTRRGRTGNIDHVVIGPAGVAVVDAKKWDGAVKVTRQTLRLGRYSGRKHLDKLAQQRLRIMDLLRQAGRSDVPVESLLCLVNGAEGLNGEVRWVDGHGIGRINPVASHVIRSGPLSQADVAEVHGLLRGHFQVGSDSVFPSMAPPSIPDPVPVKARPRVGRKLWRVVLLGVLILLFVSIVLATVGALINSVDEAIDSAASITRTELKTRLPEARALARERAGHAVKHQRIREHPDAFVVSYRSGNRCRVFVTYDKQSNGSPRVGSRGCS